ncbi:hypothetical protein [Propionispora hippei]|uniref:Uncharacterized protein n=1 Tax=Propionispora hippei DSM 15287 TaxID=1123003 RepID=A0A1M6FSC6_9FIRM|nr:hypothetical protein [Propionispora hippei]SHJ00604.1 hypothetical protein SAMN02745170_01543 [Propionispora hippei DSM 15287]
MTGINGLKTYTLSSSEIEVLLLTDFGGKLQPVDGAKLSKLKQRQAKTAVYKTRFSKPNT